MAEALWETYVAPACCISAIPLRLHSPRLLIFSIKAQAAPKAAIELNAWRSTTQTTMHKPVIKRALSVRFQPKK